MTMRKSTLWALGTAVLALLIVVGGWFLLLAPQRATAADLATQTNFAQAQNLQLQLKTKELEAQYLQLPEQRAKLAEIHASMPADTELPELLRQLETSAADTGAVLTSVTPGTPVTFDPTATTTPAVVSVPVVVSVQGSFAAVQLYLKQLQADSTRYFLLDTVSLNAGAGGVSGTSAGLTATFTGRVFVLAAAPAETAVAPADAAADPAATATS